jgi:hypothetical protein
MRRSAQLILLVALVLVATPTTAQARHGLLTGFTDGEAFQTLSPDQTQVAFSHEVAAGGSVARLIYSWRNVERTRPPSAAAATDPSWPGYDWTSVDRAVREASAAGLRVLLSWTAAPDWAEGRGRPARAALGSWRPSATAYRRFARAAAVRYSGRYPDPLGGTLPRVRYWQAWNEPNLVDYLTPQWRRRGRRFTAVSPVLYRRLLNAFYRGVKSVHRSNFVVSAGLSPFGFPTGRSRMRPALFTRELLCVRGRRHPRPFRCSSSPVYFDALAHHPYSNGGPRRRAINVDDVVIPDLRKLTRPLRAAIRAGKARPRRRKPVWVTEISWDTRPPDPDGVPIARQARYLEGALYILWRQGVTVVNWFLIRDQSAEAGYSNTLQSGIYFRGATVGADQPKAAPFTAFRFPFTAYLRRGRAQLWGLAPRPGRVSIEIRRGSRWRRLVSLRARRDRLFFRSRRIRRGSVLRARQGTSTSLDWRVAQKAAP